METVADAVCACQTPECAAGFRDQIFGLDTLAFVEDASEEVSLVWSAAAACHDTRVGVPMDETVVYQAARCVGEGYAYAEAAAPYTDDPAYFVGLAENSRLALLDAFPDAALDPAIASGQRAWSLRAELLQHSGQTGPAWQAHVAATDLCHRVSSTLRDRGILQAD